MKRVIIIQARMTSTRLPGKILKDLLGKPMLAQQIRRLRQCRAIDQIVIATTVNDTDNPVAALADQEQLPCFRGSEDDVLSRYVGAADMAEADLIVRVTADCPLIDAGVLDRVVNELADCDYATNVLERSYPRGLDVEVLTRDALKRCDQLARTASDREHVTAIIRLARPGLFEVRSVVDSVDNSDLRWTVDTATDLELIRRIYRNLNLGEKLLGYSEILSYVRSQPELMSFNVGIKTYDPVGDEPESDPES